MNFKICIPSKSRAHLMTSHKVFKSAYIYVPESEKEAYSKHKNVISIPNKIQGITATRNYILKNNNCNVFFLDDDLQYFGYIERTELKYKVVRKTDESIAIDEIKKMFNIMYQLKAKIGGFFTVGNNLTNYSWKPFLFNGVCLGSCMAIINDGTYYFDEKYDVKEDYELTLRNLKDGRATVRSNILFMQHEHTQTEGGCKDTKRVQKEKQAIINLNNKYPGMIKSAKHRGTSFALQLNI